MPILNYTSKINPTKTIGEITQNLVEHGANKIVVDYEGSLPVALTFQIILNDKPIFFELPANWEKVHKVLQTQEGVTKAYKTKEQAVRTAWRILKVWVEAQMAIIEAEIVDMAQVFLPYAITSTGETLYNHLKKSENSKILLSQPK